MSMCVLEEFVLSESFHLIQGEKFAAQFSVLTCEDGEGKEECVYWVQLFNMEGDPVMKDAHSDFLKAHETFYKLKDMLGDQIS